MNFSGTLNSIPLLDVFQLLDMARQTGTLTVVTDQGRFAVAFREGYVVGANSYRPPSALSQPDQEDGDPSERPRARGVSGGEANLRLVAGNIVKLKSGHFNFQPGVTSAAQEAGVEVSSILLDSCRLYDEELRDGSDSAVDDGSTLKSLPGPGEVGETPPIFIHELLRELPDSPCPGDVAGFILRASRSVFRRASIFLVTEDELQGVSGYSEAGCSAYGLAASLAMIRIPRDEPSTLGGVADLRVTGAGRASRRWWSAHIPEEFGPAPAEDYVAVPILAERQALMVLYGDDFINPTFEDGLRSLELLCRYSGVLLENYYLRRRLKRDEGHDGVLGRSRCVQNSSPKAPAPLEIETDHPNLILDS